MRQAMAGTPGFPSTVGRVAARLRSRGLARGDRVAAFGKNSDAYVLHQHKAVAEVAVVGVLHERWIEAIADVEVVKRELRAQLTGSAAGVPAAG